MLSNEHGALLSRHGLVRESVYAGLPERTRQFIHLTYARHLREAGSDALGADGSSWSGVIERLQGPATT
jgi:hypothetical protein